MMIIQQGKTNWMFVVIVLAVAIASGSIMMVYIQATDQLVEAPTEATFLGHKISAQQGASMPVTPAPSQNAAPSN